MSASEQCRHPKGKHRYRSVVEGVELANEFARSRLNITEFARQRGVSFNMVKYWSMRARLLAAASSSDLVQVAELPPSGQPLVVPSGPVESALPIVPQASPVVPTPPPTIEVRLPNGVRIGVCAGFSPEVLSQVVACLGARPC